MKHIHIVNPYNSAAMQRLIEPLKELGKLYELSIGDKPDIAADCNIHIPFHTLSTLEDKGNGKHVIVYTHCNPPDQQALMHTCNQADLIVAMSYEGRRELVYLGVDPKKIWVNYCAADNFAFRRRVIMVSGYVQPNGRKRESLLLDLAWKYDLSAFEFLFCGLGWDDTVNKLQAVGVPAVAVHIENDEQLQVLYHRSDLFIVTGYREGGPLPLLEAMAAGVPVLSPKMGYAADILDEADLYEDVDELYIKMMSRFGNLLDNHKTVRAWNWNDYAAEYAMLLGGLLNESVDLYPERGTSRYGQLLKVIDEVKPKNLCEIGTWNGNRAAQMIQESAKFRSIESVSYTGFDLFQSQTGEQLRMELSKVGCDRGIVGRRLSPTGANINLVEGDTKNTLSRYLENRFDFIFVDGGHSFETVENDGRFAVQQVLNGAVAVFDDYYHKGAPEGMGCNYFIDTLEDVYSLEFLPAHTITDDGREIGMVKVTRNANVHLQRQNAQTTSYTWHVGKSNRPV